MPISKNLSQKHKNLTSNFQTICEKIGFRKFKSVNLNSLKYRPDVFVYRPTFIENLFSESKTIQAKLEALESIQVVIGEVVISCFNGFPDPEYVIELIRNKFKINDLFELDPRLNRPGSVFDKIFQERVRISIYLFLVLENGFFRCQFLDSIPTDPLLDRILNS